MLSSRRMIVWLGIGVVLLLLYRTAHWDPSSQSTTLAEAGHTRHESMTVETDSNGADTSHALHDDDNDNDQPQQPVWLPYEYPVHRQLPPVSSLRDATKVQLRSKCAFGGEHIPSVLLEPEMITDDSMMMAEDGEATMQTLRRTFDFESSSPFGFWSGLSGPGPSEGDGSPWWVPSDSTASLPCTSLVQQALWRRQHPRSGCDDATFLVTKLKEGPHGIGSALTLIAHDFLSAIMLGRVLVIDDSRWYFAPPTCGGKRRRGWGCLFAMPTNCTLSSAGRGVKSVRSLAEAVQSAHVKAVRKTSYDMSGLGRNDMPSIATLLHGIGDDDQQRSACQLQVNSWISRQENRALMGTFERGTDPMLIYLLAQMTRYLLRSPQPWLRTMLKQNLAKVGLEQSQWSVRGDATSPQRVFPVVYIQDRGEVAKYREYFNAFGCHTVKTSMYLEYASALCARSDGKHCAIYISGGTPYNTFLSMSEVIASQSDVKVLSTWMHPALTTHRSNHNQSGQQRHPSENDRWGADVPLASWVDLYAGAAATAWVCIVQSNWCRLIHLLRLTSGRMQCPLIDGGIVMVSDSVARGKYCVVKDGWPTKPFSNHRKSSTPLK